MNEDEARLLAVARFCEATDKAIIAVREMTPLLRELVDAQEQANRAIREIIDAAKRGD